MKFNRLVQILLIGVVTFSISCSDDDSNSAFEGPFLNLLSGDVTLKPDSTTTFEVAIFANSGFSENNVVVDASGNGSSMVGNITGSGSTEGSLQIEFTAGSVANENAAVQIQVTDNEGLTGELNIQVTITDLDFPSVFVVNEGNFGRDNGSISSYDFRTEVVTQGTFEAGATIQNARSVDGNIYIVTNAPNKVDIVGNDFALIGSVDEGLDNPIDVAIVGSNGYVTNWGDIGTAFTDNPDSYVAIFDVESQTVTDSVLLSFRPQDIIAVGSSLYISHESASVVSIINADDNSVSTIETPFGPSEMDLDSDGNIVILCTGGSIIEIDPTSNEVTSILDGLTTSGFNEKMALDVELDILYFLGAGNSSFTGQTTVFSVDLSSSNPTAVELIAGGAALYGIGVNPETHDILLGDSNSFIATGTAFIYNRSGTLITEFATGIGPNAFLFL